MMWRSTSSTAVGASLLWLTLAPQSAHTGANAVAAAPADIAFASRRDGNWEIYVMDAAGRNQARFTRRNDRKH